MKQLFFFIGKVLLGLFLVVVITAGIGLWHVYPIRSFCNNLSSGTELTQAYKTAFNKKFFFTRNEENTGSVFIVNHASPFFRVGCEIEFKDGVIERRQFLAYD
ncbi:hypothetical protein MAH1_22480 [Sessilibacter sp. MAH1]